MLGADQATPRGRLQGHREAERHHRRGRASGCAARRRAQAAYTAAKLAALEKDRADYEGKAWKDLPPDGQSRLLRVIDELGNPTDYRVILPEGGRGEFAVNADGSRSALGWGTYQFIDNAISILRDGSVANIDAMVGDEHKVRSFFNNISNPETRTASRSTRTPSRPRSSSRSLGRAPRCA